MEYLGKSYIFDNLKKGDLRFIQKRVVNPKNNKNYSYDTIRRVLQGNRNNKIIIDFTRKYLKLKEKLGQDAAKQSA